MADEPFNLEALEYHACSSGTSTAPLVRQQILAGCAEIRRLQAALLGVRKQAYEYGKAHGAVEGALARLRGGCAGLNTRITDLTLASDLPGDVWSELCRIDSELRALLKDPGAPERRVGRYTHLVIIIREGVSEVRGFEDLSTAADWHDNAGAQWSESYLTEVIKGPLT